MDQGPGRVAHSVTCLAADMCQSDCRSRGREFDPWSHTFMEIDHEMISMVILLPSAGSRRVVVSYKRKYVQEVLVKCLVKHARGEKNG